MRIERFSLPKQFYGKRALPTRLGPIKRVLSVGIDSDGEPSLWAECLPPLSIFSQDDLVDGYGDNFIVVAACTRGDAPSGEYLGTVVYDGSTFHYYRLP